MCVHKCACCQAQLHSIIAYNNAVGYHEVVINRDYSLLRGGNVMNPFVKHAYFQRNDGRCASISPNKYILTGNKLAGLFHGPACHQEWLNTGYQKKIRVGIQDIINPFTYL